MKTYEEIVEWGYVVKIQKRSWRLWHTDWLDPPVRLVASGRLKSSNHDKAEQLAISHACLDFVLRRVQIRPTTHSTTFTQLSSTGMKTWSKAMHDALKKTGFTERFINAMKQP